MGRGVSSFVRPRAGGAGTLGSRPGPRPGSDDSCRDPARFRIPTSPTQTQLQPQPSPKLGLLLFSEVTLCSLSKMEGGFHMLPGIQSHCHSKFTM